MTDAQKPGASQGPRFSESLAVSAVTGTGITTVDGLSDQVLAMITAEEATSEYHLPVERGDLLARLRSLGTILEECYNDEHMVVNVRLAKVERQQFDLLLKKNGLPPGNPNSGQKVR